MNLNKILVSFILLFSCLLSFGRENNQSLGGLFFNNDEDIVKRTSYDVFEQPVRMSKDSLSISFSARLHGVHSIGHLITSYTEENELFNIIIKEHTDPQNRNVFFFNLNMKALSAQLVVKAFKEDVVNRWFDVRISFNFVEGQVLFSVNGVEEKLECDMKDIFANQKAKYVFGRCQHYLDIYPFSLRNVRLGFDRNAYVFPLDELSGTAVHDRSGNASGTVSNPTWLYRSHVAWREVSVIEEDENAAICNDTENSRIILYTSDKIYQYDLVNDAVTESENDFPEKFRFVEGGASSYAYVPGSGDLVMFNRENQENPWNIGVYNMKNRTMEAKGNSYLDGAFHHAATFVDKKGENIYDFGGYSCYKYHNVFHRLNLKDYRWNVNEFAGERIEPRFYVSCATDYADDRELVYLYGGYGNMVGDQDVGGEYFHDLFRLDMKEGSITRLADFDVKNFDKVPCRNLILGEDGHSFYTLCYPQYEPESTLQLYRFDWETGTVEPYSKEYPFISQQIATQINLFESKKYECLICVVQEFIKGDQCNIRILKLDEPAVPYLPEDTGEEVQKAKGTLWIVIGILLLLAVTAAVFYWYRARNGAQAKEGGKMATVAGKEEEEVKECPVVKEFVEPEPVLVEEKKINSIFLLGEFTVFDREGKDITYLFSAKIRQLFLLILLYTYRNTSQGIASKEISIIMWPEKEVSESKNIRGVTIKYLRDALSGVEGIEVVSRGGKWYVDIDKEVCNCDFLNLREADLTGLDNYDDIRPYIHMLRRGTLLETEHYEWLDNFKAEYEELILNKLTQKMTHAFDSSQFLISYKIAQVLLGIAPLNEDIMKIEINSLIKLGDPVKAKIKFRQFSVNYYESYGENLQYEDYVM